MKVDAHDELGGQESEHLVIQDNTIQNKQDLVDKEETIVI